MATEDKALDHAWNYFALHANQRISVFNYFVVFAGVLCTGIAAAVQGSRGLAGVGCTLGLLLILLSFVFWKLDQRTSLLIKHAEDAIMTLEPSTARVLATEEARTDSASSAGGVWTYGRSFRTIFAVMALVGAAGAGLAGGKAAGWLDLGAKEAGEAMAVSETRASGALANVELAETSGRGDQRANRLLARRITVAP